MDGSRNVRLGQSFTFQQENKAFFRAKMISIQMCKADRDISEDVQLLFADKAGSTPCLIHVGECFVYIKC